jgi:peptide/nickel transport system ATP-binding protein
MGKKLLEIKNLKQYFYTDDGVVPAVDGVSITVNKGEVLGIVGESGSGKSVTFLKSMRLISQKAKEGTIEFEGKNVLELSERQMQKIRGKEMSMIFQEPMTSLNPVFSIGNQIGEALKTHMRYKRSEVKNKSIELLKLVGIPRAEQIINEYPHQLSGGMRQRVMIAMAMACNPKLLIADEPTTALDVTIQAQILDLMQKLKEQQDMTIVLISHDMGVIAEMCDRVIVMYAGTIVEESEVIELFENPSHPYTWGLIKSMPTLETDEERLYSIKGSVLSAQESQRKGCPFAPRCEFAMDICLSENPPQIEVSPGHYSKCWLSNTKCTSDNKEEKKMLTNN